MNTTMSPDSKALLKVLSQLQEQNLQLQNALSESAEQNKSQSFLIEKLQNEIEKLLRVLYGKKSERKVSDEIGENKLVVNPKKLQTPANTDKIPNGRGTLPGTLERQVIKHEIPPENRTCKCCGIVLTMMGKTVSEQLDFVPAKLIVKEHRRYKYACKNCKANVVTADMPAQPIDKGLPGAGLLAEILVSKYQDHLPLHRQEQRWARLGYALPRSTQCDWVAHCASSLEPIVDAMKVDALMRSPKINTDDTTVPVQAKGKCHTGRLWVYIGGGLNVPPCVIYQYSKTRRQKVPQLFLGDYEGYLQADAYPGYNILYKGNKIIEIACMAHVRRKFFDCTQKAGGDSLGHAAIDFIAKLYDIERRAKALSDRQRQYYRRYYAKPLLKQFNIWLRKQCKLTLPKSPIHLAIKYALNHFKALTNYLRKGYLEIDNNRAERAIKPVVIGRKNYLFAGSHDGGHRAAIIYSLIETCKACDINPYAYLADILAKLPSTLMKNINSLLPYNWKPTLQLN